MATIKIWDISHSVNKTLNYISNQTKTKNDEYSEPQEQSLASAINYAVDGDKTMKKFFVTALNCQEEFAYEQMMETKKEYKKESGILAYHAVQSFAPGEVTPEEGHAIGVEFAKAIWSNRFEVLVSTHVNTDCVHNHFVINSVSCLDGKKYYDNKKNYRRMRDVSDEICIEHGLSVIKEPQPSRKVPYNIYMDEKLDNLTKNSIIRRDIDECILVSISRKDFMNKMKKLGYVFDFTRKYPTISHPQFARPRRLHTLGEDYAIDSLMQRVDESWRRYQVDIPPQENLQSYLMQSTPDETYQGVYVKFVTIVSIVKERPNANREAQKILYQEIRKLDKLIEQQNLLCGNDIDTPEQLADFKQSRKEEIKELEEARNRLRNKLKVANRNGDEIEVAEIKEHISYLSERLKKLRRDIFVCEQIENQKPIIDDRIEEIKHPNQRKERKVNEQFRRSR